MTKGIVGLDILAMQDRIKSFDDLRSRLVCRCCGDFIRVMAQKFSGYCSQLCENGRCEHANSDRDGGSGSAGSAAVRNDGSCGT